MASMLRSLLFVPGHQARFYEKLAKFRPDAVILDLEDAVPPAEKASARAIIREHLNGPLLAGLGVFVRVNACGLPFFRDDLRTVVAAGLDGIFVPKVESAEALREANMVLAQAEVRAELRMGSVRLIPILETVSGVLRAEALARATPRIQAIAFGAEDFTLDLGVERTRDGLETRYPRAHVAMAARAAGVLALDTPWTDMADGEGLRREAREARQLGFTGKAAIHPDQIPTINDVFTPSDSELEHARRVIASYEEAVTRGTGAISLDGQLIDVPMVERARRLLDSADA